MMRCLPFQVKGSAFAVVQWGVVPYLRVLPRTSSRARFKKTRVAKSPIVSRRMPDSTEADLIERARKGERAAFGLLIRMHQRRVYACAIQMLGNAQEADDATQETFLRAFKAIAKFDGRSELSTWLYRICVNLSLNLLRKRKRQKSEDLDDPRIPEPEADVSFGDNDPRRALERVQVYRKLAEAMDALSPSLRATVMLVCIEGVSHKAAAEALGCPEGTIAWRIHEARARLLDALGDSIPEDIENVISTSARRAS